jgi:hypothetical protein
MRKEGAVLICVMLFFSSCDVTVPNEKKNQQYHYVDKPCVQDMYNLYGKESYIQLYSLLNDSIKNHEKINYKNLGFEPTLILDSIIFMNNSKDFVIGNIIYLAHGNSMDGIFPVFFRKFNSHWYVNGGGSKPIAAKSLSYGQVHKIINKGQPHLIYRKKPNGKLYVKEEMFENNSYSDQQLKQVLAKMSYPDSPKEWNYQQYFVETSIRNFYRETLWQLQYLPENYSFSYSKSKKELTVTAKIPYWHEFPIDHTATWGNKATKYDFGDNSYLRIIKKGQNVSIYSLQNINDNQEIDLLFNMRMRANPNGMVNVFYRFKLTNGKVTFVKLVPHEQGLLDYYKDDKIKQDSARVAWQKIIDQTFGKNYGKNSKIKSVVVD